MADRTGTPLKDIRKRLPLRVLSEADWRNWTSDGYVIVRHPDTEVVEDALSEVVRKIRVELG